MLKRSPLAPERFPKLPAVPGVRIAGIAAGLKESRRRDLLLAELAPGTTVAGAFTRSACASAPVVWCRKVLPKGKARGVVVDSGNANAFTGNAGDKTVDATARAAAKLLGCPKNEIYIASTGVIGVPVPPNHVARNLPKVAKKLAQRAWHDAARAIMTTDTFAKAAFRTARIGGEQVTLAGITKGSGMIAPDMATNLTFVFTDAKIPASVLQTLLSATVERSFNCITVDGDTSTSDTALLFATGKGARHKPIAAAGDRHLAKFKAALDELMVDLATQVVRDGEGAEKLVTIDISGAASATAARRIGLSIANSPLVKTAIAGGDPNWGRIVMAVGKAGEKADRDKLSIAMGGVQITENGQRRRYSEKRIARHMAGRDVRIAVDVGVGKGKARVWTCDLTHGYITINADYRT